MGSAPDSSNADKKALLLSERCSVLPFRSPFDFCLSGARGRLLFIGGFYFRWILSWLEQLLPWLLWALTCCA